MKSDSNGGWRGDGGRILFISSNFPPVTGGSAVVYDRMCRLNARNIVALAPLVDYRTANPLADTARYDRECGFIIHRIHSLRPVAQARRVFPGWRFLSLIGDMTTYIAVGICVAKLCKRYRIRTVCVGELIYGGWVGLLAKYVLNKKFVIYAHGEEISQANAHIAGFLRRAYLHRADFIICVSNFCAVLIQEKFMVPREKIKIIFNGVDTSKFYPRKKKTVLIEKYNLRDAVVLGTIGRLTPRKGVDMVIRSLPNIRSKINNISYIIIGEGKIKEQLEELAQKLNVEDSVNFIGYVKDEEIPDYYVLMDLFIMPNRELPDGDTEGFGLVFLEANACGVPVIGGRAGGAPEAIGDGVTGLLVDGCNPEAIAEAVCRILGDRGLREKLSRQGRAVAIEASWETRAHEFIETIEAISLD